MLTAFADKIDRRCPRAEYPRPQLARERWMSLNGPWEFAGAPRDAAPQRFGGEILVPFPPESPLSGIEKPCPKGYCVWYRRAFTLPADFADGRVLLHFDAVDQTATVWLNGALAGEHSGGYTPFTLDVTALLRAQENILLVRAVDDGDKSACAFGGQARRAAWSGIWQSVWCECVPEKYIDSLRIVPRAAERAVDVTVYSADGVDGQACAAQVGGALYELTTGVAYTLPVPEAALWTPESPALHALRVSYGEDTVESYFALREFGLGLDERGRPCFLLNGAPIFVSGVLDQSLWPDGLAAAPTDEALQADILAAKRYGFNTLRLRDKIECPRFYYHCDALGLMVWQGIPTGGRDKPPLLPVADDKYAFYGRRDAENRQQHRRELREAVELLRNAPSVVLWELFDEGRGQFDAASLLRYVDELDGSRPVDPVSGGDAPVGQLRTLHFFGKKLGFLPDKKGRVTALSACGGCGNVTDGHVVPGKCSARAIYDSPQGLLFAIEELYADVVRPAAEAGLAGCIYSQLTDVETDVSGLLPYDRRIEKLSPRQLRKIFTLRF